MTQQPLSREYLNSPAPPAPAYLDPLHDELDRLRTENRRLNDHLSNATVAARAGAVAEIMLEQAEARVDQLTDQLTLANDTLRHRATAVNATGATNDTLRATIARVEKLHRKTYDSPSDEAYQRNAVCDNCEVSWPCGTIAALADQEPTP